MVIALCLSFSILYNLSFVAFPSLTTARLATVIILTTQFSAILVFLKKEINLPSAQFFYYILICSIVFSFSQFLFGSLDSTQVSRLIYLLLFSIIGGIGIAAFLRFNLNYVALVISSAVFVQAIFIFLEYSYPSFHFFTVSVLNQSKNYNSEWIRAIGFTNGGGSSLSMIQFSGFALCLFLLKASDNLKSSFAFIFMAVTIFCSTILTGRTGLIFEIALAITYPLYSGKLDINKIVKTIIVFTLIIILLVFYLENILEVIINYNPKFEFLLPWLSEISEFSSGGTANALKAMNVPSMSIDTILGTGRVVTADGLNSSGSDIGYIQTYFSLGLIFTILFYVSLFIYYSNGFYRYFRSEYLFWQIFVIVIFISEYKEPFIFKYGLIFVLSSIFACKYNNRKTYAKNKFK